MAFIVQRIPGDKPGPSISSSVLTDDSSKIERGRQEINRNDSDRKIVTGDLIQKDINPYNVLVQCIDTDGTITAGIVDEFSMDAKISSDSLSVNVQEVIEQVRV